MLKLMSTGVDELAERVLPVAIEVAVGFAPAAVPGGGEDCRLLRCWGLVNRAAGAA